MQSDELDIFYGLVSDLLSWRVSDDHYHPTLDSTMQECVAELYEGEDFRVLSLGHREGFLISTKVNWWRVTETVDQLKVRGSSRNVLWWGFQRTQYLPHVIWTYQLGSTEGKVGKRKGIPI